MRQCLFTASFILASFIASASTHNIAPLAEITASSALEGCPAQNIADGIARVDNQGCWVSQSHETFWGEIDYPWIKLEWSEPHALESVLIYDLPNPKSNIASCVLRFSDGSQERVLQIPDDGAPIEVSLHGKLTKWILLEATDGDGSNLGLSEIEVFPTPDDQGDRIGYVNPYIETTRGRYFFFVTGSQPFGMISAAPLTRNKNQEGGGYNYNSRHILSFPQIHGWMLSGIELMPAFDIDKRSVALTGHDGWKSELSHVGELVEPAYHRLYLDRYDIWVEQTCGERASLYRITYCQDGDGALILNLGGYVSTSTMVNAHAHFEAPNRIFGWFDTVGRLWGGPDKVRIFFVTETDREPSAIDTYLDGEILPGDVSLEAPDQWQNRNEGLMSYADAPTAGFVLHFNVEAGGKVMARSAFSLTSLENAIDNLASSCSDWDFDSLRNASQQEWERQFAKIQVKGGSLNQRIKLYTDLWHSLLGRHKINDHAGTYPDYFERDTVIASKFDKGSKLKIRQLPRGKDGLPLHNTYNSDALWLSQWNLNNLWGIAYPEVLDDFAASFLQTSIDGGLLARGPCAGGYSYIMSGCLATTLIASAYQQGLTRKWDPEIALAHMKRNHEASGMQGWGAENEHEFYSQNGYCPDRGGLTVQWCFEDWVLAQMARSLGDEEAYQRYYARSHGWTESFHPECHLLLPRRADGSWLHSDPLSGWGFEEANAWQTTFGLSHDIPLLAQIMGGEDALCDSLQHAFVMAQPEDFIKGYGSGYVSYANQPGLSSAHVFGHAGRPWLTQYWVRQVKEQAYGGVTPDLGYGGHDEDQGQMSSLSALMAIGLFSLTGCTDPDPLIDITAPVFDEISIPLNQDYYPGKEITIVAHDNSPDNCYIQRLAWNGTPLDSCQIRHSQLTSGGQLDIWLGPNPRTDW